jgi:P-type conjugative transfer ATPase TrbB
MGILNDNEDSRRNRSLERLSRDLGDNFLKKFNDPNLIEVMVNPSNEKNGNKLSIYWEYIGQPMVYDSELSNRFTPTLVEIIIKTISGYHDKVINADNPILECQFPLDHSRFTALIPPVSISPSFVIRKRPKKIFTLDEYISQGIMTLSQKQIIQNAVKAKDNILVVGGTGSGKTTLVNAVIKEMTEQDPNDRMYIAEDTGEIQCESKNIVNVYTTPDIGLTKLVRTALRLRPDRVIVGEVRGEEALDLLDVWNTGHPGGIATLHANSAILGLDRLEGLISRNPAHPIEIRKLISQVINTIIFIAKEDGTRKIKEIIKVIGYDMKTKSFLTDNQIK